MHKNSQTPIALLSPMPATSLSTKKATPSESNQTLSSTMKAPPRKFMRRSFTPIGLNYSASPAYTPIEKSNILESPRDFLDGSITPINTSMCNLFFNSANRANCLTPQQMIVKKTEINKTFTIRGSKAMKTKIDADDRASIRRVLHLSMDSPLTETPLKPIKGTDYAFSPVEFGERPPTPMPMCNDAQHSGEETTFTANILNQTINIATVLKDIGMEKYTELFEREEIDVFVFSMLKSDDLTELGIDEIDRPAFVHAFITYRDVFGNINILDC